MKSMKLTDGTSYSMVGTGPLLVLIHGVGLSKEMWGGQIAGLAEYFCVITYDMLGHGDSPDPGNDATLEDYAEQLNRLLDELDIQEPVNLVGFSMGGLIARAFALKHAPRLSRMVILNSVFNRNEEQRLGVVERSLEVEKLGPGANVDGALERWFSKEYQAANSAQIAHFRKQIIENRLQGYLTTYQLFGLNDNYGADRLANIRIPVLVATGELDVGSTPTMAQELAELLPFGRACVLPNQRHMMPVESPVLVNEMLLSFLHEDSEVTYLKEVSNGA
ncbi:alpha/beta fold hydrolase [Zobellella maritima]|uniref:alpha/beta fold hydrolase n=1 Tax=Zobellella maritima TaxID=2059725 RepID=UPI0018E56B40|nr:alpha/beta hydrolase [Zobellella maritima]